MGPSTGVARPEVVREKLGSISVRLLVLVTALALEYQAFGWTAHPWWTMHRFMTGAIVFCAVPFLLGRAKYKSVALTTGLERLPFSGRALLVHVAGASAVVALQLFLLRPNHSSLYSAAVVAWFVAVLGTAVSLTVALIPASLLIEWIRAFRSLWLYAALLAALAVYASDHLEGVWNGSLPAISGPVQSATYAGVRALLVLVFRDVFVSPALHTIGTATFRVEIAGGCSGIEGLGLILILTVGWLFYSRRELRLARALWLVPISLVVIWCLNILRIAALIAIGNAGYPNVAVNGFHAQAGWITLNAVAVGFLSITDRMQWFHVMDRTRVLPTPAVRNVAAIYLLPFLAIMGTSLITQAVSSGFEWLYPLRLVVACAVLLYFRREYGLAAAPGAGERRPDWRFSWPGPLAGLLVFLMWLVFARVVHLAPSGLGTSLAAFAPWQRWLWIAARVLAAVVTVPIAEELAFRGFLARRLMSADVESVPFRSLTVLSIVASSVAFGMLHGKLWMAGILAGLAFALVARLRNRLGEAVAAHAVANACIAIWVLSRGDYTLW